MSFRRFFGTAAQRAASSQVGTSGDLWIDSDSGNFGVADGVNLLSGMPGLPILSKAGLAWWNKVTALAPAADQPTITVDTTSAITGTNVIAPSTDMVYDAAYRYDGTLALSSPSAGYVNATTSPANIAPEFTTDDANDRFEFTVRTSSNSDQATSPFMVRVEIDGKPHSMRAQSFATTVSTIVTVHVVFPGARSRRIKLWTYNCDWFGGVKVATGQTVTRPSADVKRRLCVIADSYGAGGPNYPANSSRIETFPYWLYRLFECDSLINLAVSGTGWVNDNGAGQAYGTRIPTMLAASPHIALFVGSRNDIAGGVDQSLVYPNALAGLTEVADLPLVYVFGSETASASLDTVTAGLKAAAQRAGRRFFDIRGLETTTDTGHPVYANQLTIAQAMYALLDRSHVDATVAATVGGRVAAGVTLAASPVGSTYQGGTVTLTATLTAAQAGTVKFYSDGVLIGSAAVSGTTASVTTSSLSIATHNLTARFVPQDPLNVKPATSNVVSYTISNNLGFVDHFSGSGQPVNTENGKAWDTAYITNFTQSGGLLSAPAAAGSVYMDADAQVVDGVFTVVMAGTFNLNLAIVLRYASGNNNVFLNWNGGSNNPKLWSKSGGVSTAIATGTGGAWAAGDTIVVTISGTTYTVTKNGTVILTADTTTTNTGLNANTKHGLFFNASTTACAINSVQFVAP